MKITHLSFQNLNSLEGKWSIDFTVPEFESEGIFVITGPTGVGKTTILDAICLALYGRTPRLDRINGSTNDIMSRQTGDCFAEVTFTTTNGSYRSHWSQRRARNKPGGRLQAPQHEIANAINGDILESQLSKVAKRVEKICGMDFKRFTRSVMLAQGAFAEFLQSTADDRSDILEQITGTAIYSEISKLVHVRKSEHESTLKQHKALMEGIQILDTEAESSLRAATAELETIAKRQLNTQQQLQKSAQWLDSIQRERQLIDQTQLDLTSHLAAQRNFAPDALRLSLAQKAHTLHPIDIELASHRRDAASCNTKINTLSTQISEAQETSIQANKESSASAAALDLAHKKREDAAPQIIQARKIDSDARHINTRITETIVQWKLEDKMLVACQERQKIAADRLKQLNNKIASANAFVAAHPHFTSLHSELSGFKQRATAWSDSHALYTEAERSLKALTLKISNTDKSITQASADHSAKVTLLETSRNHRTSLEKSLRTSLDSSTLESLEKDLDHLSEKLALENRIASLEDERKKLVAGNPCNVCGSTSHPYATDELPDPSETENAIRKINSQIKQIRKLDADLSAQSLTIEKAESACSHAKLSLDSLHEQIDKEKQTEKQQAEVLTKFANKSTSAKEDILTALAPYLPDTTITLTNIEELLQNLTTELKTYQSHVTIIDSSKDEITQLKTTLIHEADKLDGHSKKRASLTEDGTKYREQHDALLAEIRSIVGSDSIDKFEQKLKKSLDDAQSYFQQKDKLREQSANTLNEYTAAKKQLTSQLEHLKNEIDKLETKLSDEVLALDFPDVAAYHAARLDAATRDKLAASLRQLQDRQAEIDTTLKGANARLSTELSKKLTELPAEQIKLNLQSITEELTQTSRLLGANNQQLTTNETSQAQLADKVVTLKNLEKELTRWVNIHGLIGSSDGKKFRNFAQGLTFEIMVRHANFQLTKMSDRYQLIRDKDAPLNLNVIDAYQAGEIRSTKNLSGGESFIISLALALGLSQMASKTVRVDSLFLDEGFGTLDEESLETALETLSSLNQDGKIIGIISHIAALKERISTQLNLSPTQQGRSKISGPGVTNIPCPS